MLQAMTHGRGPVLLSAAAVLILGCDRAAEPVAKSATIPGSSQLPAAGANGSPVDTLTPASGSLSEPGHAGTDTAPRGEVTIVEETYASGKPYNEHGEKTLPSGKRVRHGPIAAWYEEGGKWLEGNYENGKLDGWWRYWHKNGQLEREGQYANGLQDGYWVAHWDNGQRMSEGEMRGGLYVGHWKAWHRDGTLRYEGDFVDGKREGTWLFFNPDGTPDASLTGEYKNNVKVR